MAQLTQCAKTGKGNLLDLAVNAARNRATLGEISDALESVLEDKKHKLEVLVACIVKKLKRRKFEKAKNN